MKYLLTILAIIISLFSESQKKVTVAQDGSGNYRTVQAAFDAIPMANKIPTTVFIKKGIYKEKIHLDSSKNQVTLLGEDKFETVLTYNDHSGKISPRGDTINTYTSESVLIRADNFRAENITFENNAGFTAGQAVAMHAAGDKMFF